MESHNTATPTDDVLLSIVQAPETHGLDRYDYQLHDAIDVEALDHLLDSSTDTLEVEFTIRDLRVEVTRTQVTATTIAPESPESSQTTRR